MIWYQKRGSKYGAKKTVTGGRQYDSKKEAGYAQTLEARRLAGELTEVRPQVTLRLFCYGVRVCNYRMDFVTTTTDGVIELTEVKGFPTPEWKLKWKILEACKDTEDFRAANGWTMDDDIQMVLIT